MRFFLKKILSVFFILIGISIIIIIFYNGFLFVSHDFDINFLKIDRCLDHGGKWNHALKMCEGDNSFLFKNEFTPTEDLSKYTAERKNKCDVHSDCHIQHCTGACSASKGGIDCAQSEKFWKQFEGSKCLCVESKCQWAH